MMRIILKSEIYCKFNEIHLLSSISISSICIVFAALDSKANCLHQNKRTQRCVQYQTNKNDNALHRKNKYSTGVRFLKYELNSLSGRFRLKWFLRNKMCTFDS